MTMLLTLSLKEGMEQPSDEDTQSKPITVAVVSQVTLGRGEDTILTKEHDDQQSDAEFNRQMALLKNPHVDLSPFYANERGVSRKHARISIRNMRLSVADLGSTNGTYVNNQKLEPNVEYPIQEGDELRLGFLTMTFVTELLET